jgi:hypothetical protein
MSTLLNLELHSYPPNVNTAFILKLTVCFLQCTDIPMSVNRLSDLLLYMEQRGATGDCYKKTFPCELNIDS